MCSNINCTYCILYLTSRRFYPKRTMVSNFSRCSEISKIAKRYAIFSPPLKARESHSCLVVSIGLNCNFTSSYAIVLYHVRCRRLIHYLALSLKTFRFPREHCFSPATHWGGDPSSFTNQLQRLRGSCLRLSRRAQIRSTPLKNYPQALSLL